ncbi:glycosyltransferase family protein [Aliarcobacter skirrowii]|uniref:hypothetical protein n=1 Tax=Aliarcobacter skirrowii TaxID=28200 RepID=UPI0029A23606|nr:hypothetical protein [Aliarcobacter skirrowii]MDX4037402.1 hypothetical protein [Aliarcobacter skirrowii]
MIKEKKINIMTQENNLKLDDLAPIVLFTYRRIPKETIESLLQNDLAKQSEIYIYSDGYKSEVDKNDVLEVREYLKTIEGFKSTQTIEAPHNKGLANSIIGGVTEIINKYHKVIVLEDDLIVSSDFLEYMNEALEFYKNDEKIWSISGYGPKLPCLENYDKDLYLSPRGSSWGWATWKDRWGSVDWDVKDFEKLKRDKQMRKEFELGGDDMYKMLELQMLGKIDSWAIRWCFFQFLQNKHTVYPKFSKIINDGFGDSKGTHNSGDNTKWQTLLNHKTIKFEPLQIDDKIIQCYKRYHDLSLYTKTGYVLKKYGGYKMVKKIIGKFREI